MLKPKKAYLNFHYQCKCGHDIYLSLKEAKCIGKAYCEFCHKVNVLEPISDVKIKLIYKRNFHEYKNKESKEKIDVNANANENQKNKGNISRQSDSSVFKSLVSLGYKQKEAQKLVEKARFILGADASEEEVVRKAIGLK